MFQQSQPRLSFMALAIGTTFFASPVLADPVIGASSMASANSIAAVSSNPTSPGFVGSFSSISNAAGNGSANSFANTGGAYAVRSTSQGIATGSAHAQLAYTLTNSTGVAQSYSMSFHVYGGSINAGLNNFGGGPAPVLIAGEFLSAQYAASVKVNGVSMFSSTAGILKTNTGTTFTKTGTDLNSGDDGTDGFYSWGGGYFDIALGTLGAGESLTVLAELDDSSQANVGTYNFGGGGGYGCGGYGDGNPTAAAGGDSNAVAAPVCFKGQANAFYGDPAEFFGSANSGNGIQQTSFSNAPAGNDVPEPASLPLAALALAGAVAATRRRKLAPA